MEEVDQKQALQLYSDMFNKGFGDMAAAVADVLADEEAKKPNQILSKKAYRDRFEIQILQEMQTFKTRIENGSFQIMQKLIELSSQDKEMFSEVVVDDLTKLVGLANIVASKKEEFFEQLSQEKTLLQIAHVSNQTFEKMYQAAKQLYTEKQFQESADAFGLLTVINPASYSCWLGLGNSEFFLNHYEQALFAYAFCCKVNPSEPTCHIFSSQCYEQIKEIDNAINAIDLALFVISNNPEHKGFKPELEAEKQRLATKINQ
jgi:tetratricopeptide (TPR) repeat protein